MRLRLVLFLIAIALLSQARVNAAFAQAGPLDPVLDACDGDPALRARLFSLADSVAAADPVLASEALSITGQSFARRGELDSAVVCYQRAMALDPREPRRMDLAGALLSRLGPDDAARARDVLRPVQPITPRTPIPRRPPQGCSRGRCSCPRGRTRRRLAPSTPGSAPRGMALPTGLRRIRS
jgi:hypothetical protein